MPACAFHNTRTWPKITPGKGGKGTNTKTGGTPHTEKEAKARTRNGRRGECDDIRGENEREVSRRNMGTSIVCNRRDVQTCGVFRYYRNSAPTETASSVSAMLGPNVNAWGAPDPAGAVPIAGVSSVGVAVMVVDVVVVETVWGIGVAGWGKGGY